MLLNEPFITSMIIPTGIGASVGGFAGDATPMMNLLASVSDMLITHPNVANAAVFQNLPQNALYVEGYGLDRFFKGEWALAPVRKNAIGIVYDAGIAEEMLTLHRNVVNALRTVYGIEIMGEAITDEPVRLECGYTPSGSSTGTLHNPETILKACRSLLEKGATAIALCVAIPTLDDAAYQFEGAVDPVGGIEAILSHLVVSELNIPCAHAPVFSKEDAMPEFESVVDPRVAAECIAPTFLPCVLLGLSRAPQFATKKNEDGFCVTDLSALVVPNDALGGVPVLSALERKIPVIAVGENRTVMRVDVSALEKLLPEASLRCLYGVRSYVEAGGLLQMIKNAQAVPEAFQKMPASGIAPVARRATRGNSVSLGAE